MKAEQERKAEEKKVVVMERCGEPKELEDLDSEGNLLQSHL